MSRSFLSNLFVFLREWIRSPRHMGAVIPSSRYLAKAIATKVPFIEGERIIELGGGTGAITQALLEKGIASDQLTVVELSVPLAQHLQKQFPDVTILNGNATHLRDLVGMSSERVNIIVSGLPLRSLPEKVVASIADEVAALIGTDGLLIQFTYSWRKHLNELSNRFILQSSSNVWVNFPPARIDVYTLKQ